MKKGIIGFLVSVIVIIGVAYAVLSIDFNRINKDTYYVQITKEGLLQKDKLDTGEVMETYNYKLDAVSKEGREKVMEFTANKNLKKNAYLKLYVKKNSNTVSSYDEVNEKDLPEKVKEKIN